MSFLSVHTPCPKNFHLPECGSSRPSPPTARRAPLHLLQNLPASEVGGQYFLSRPAWISWTIQPAAPIWPRKIAAPFATPEPEAHQPGPCPASPPKAPSPRGSVSRPRPVSKAPHTPGRQERGCSGSQGTGRAGLSGGKAPGPAGSRLPRPGQPSGSAGPRLRGLPSPDPGSRRCRCPPCPSRSRRGLSASLPWWSPGSHAGRRPDSPLARLPVGPPLPPPPPPLDPHKGDRACALRSAPWPRPLLAARRSQGAWCPALLRPRRSVRGGAFLPPCFPAGNGGGFPRDCAGVLVCVCYGAEVWWALSL